MKITMPETRRGSENGFTVSRFHQGETYEVTDALACSFTREGWAVEEFPLFELVKGIVMAFDVRRS